MWLCDDILNVQFSVLEEIFRAPLAILFSLVGGCGKGVGVPERIWKNMVQTDVFLKIRRQKLVTD